MMIQPIYYAVFYDLAKPQNLASAMNKRIEESLFYNITDDMGRKEVELKTADEGEVANYRIISISTFNISNTVDNHFFVICYCKKT